MKTARFGTVSVGNTILSQQAFVLVQEAGEALNGIVRLIILGSLLLAVLRVVFQLVGSETSSIAQTVTTLSGWLVTPFSNLSTLGASIAATVSLVLINGIFASLNNQFIRKENT